MKLVFRRKTGFYDRIIHRFKSLFLKAWSRVVELFHQWSGQIRRKEVLSRMHKADIVLASPRTSSLSLTALLYRLVLGSRYIHSMLYLGDEKIIHTTARHGVVVSHVPSKIYKKHRYAIFRVKGLAGKNRDKVVQEALKWKYKKLDHSGLIINVPARLLGFKKTFISQEKNRIWCSKLIYQSFYAAGVELMPPEKAHVITSEDLTNIPNIKRVVSI